MSFRDIADLNLERSTWKARRRSTSFQLRQAEAVGKELEALRSKSKRRCASGRSIGRLFRRLPRACYELQQKSGAAFCSMRELKAM